MTDNCPLVSVIVPCYNVEKYVGKCLSSILDQTYDKIQVVIVNDGSADNTEKVILSYKDAFLTKGHLFDYVYQDNQGVGFAVNNALKHIKGEYFCWIDSDDWYDEKYVETVVHYFKNHIEYSIVRVNAFVVSETGEKIGYRTTDKEEISGDNAFEHCLMVQHFSFCGAGGGMIKTSDFDKVVSRREIYCSKWGQNWQLYLPMLYHYKVKFIDKPLQYILARTNSLSREGSSKYTQNINREEEYFLLVKNALISLNISDCDKYLKMINTKYYHRFYYLATAHDDFSREKKYYKIFNFQIKCPRPDVITGGT